MANTITIQLRAEAAPFAAEVRALEASARRLNSSFDSATRNMEQGLSRVAASARTTRAEIEKIGTAGRGGAGGAGGGLPFGISEGAVVGAAGTAVAAVVAFGKASVESYREAAGAQITLEASARRASVAFQDQQRIVARLRTEYGLTTAEAQSALAASLRAASSYGRPGDAETLLRSAISSSLASGKGAGYATQVLSSVQNQSDEQLNAIGLQNPEGIYKSYAASIGVATAALTEFQKRQAIANAIIRQGAGDLDLASKAANTAAGRYNQLLARLEDYKASVGKAALEAAFYAKDRLTPGGGQQATQDIYGGVQQGVNAAAQAINFVRQALNARQDRIDETNARYDNQRHGFRVGAVTDALRIQEFADAQRSAIPGRIAALQSQRDAVRRDLTSGALGLSELQVARAALDGGETGEQRRKRIYTTADDLARRGGDLASARYTAATLGGYDPRTLTKESQERLKAALDKLIEAEKQQADRQIKLLENIDKNIAKANGATPFDDPKKAPDLDLTIRNQVEGTTARIAEVSVDGEQFTL